MISSAIAKQHEPRIGLFVSLPERSPQGRVISQVLRAQMRHVLKLDDHQFVSLETGQRVDQLLQQLRQCESIIPGLSSLITQAESCLIFCFSVTHLQQERLWEVFPYLMLGKEISFMSLDHRLDPNGIPQPGCLTGWGTSEDGSGTLSGSQNNITITYDLSLKQLVSDPLLLTCPTLATNSDYGFQRLYLYLPLTLWTPWPTLPPS